MSHIESFNRCAALIFARLYTTFPLRAQLTFSDLPEKVFEDIDEDDFDGAFERLVVYEKTAEWLVSAGYVWVEQIDHVGLHGAVLSPKGLEVLKAVPDALEQKTPLGERLGQLVQQGSYSLLSKVVDQALTLGVSLAVGGKI